MRRILIWAGLPLLAFLVARGLATQWPTRHWASMTRSAPVAEFPETIDLGERESGDVAEARLIIANRGGGELVVDHIRTNCSCAGLERQDGDKLIPVETLRIAGGEQADLVVRVAVRGIAPVANIFDFQTNDPTRPNSRVVITVPRITGSLAAEPTSILLGTFPVGQEVRRVVDVRDAAAVPRTLTYVESSDPERVRARLLPHPASDREDKTLAGTLIGRVEVVVQSAQPATVNASVTVQLAGEVRRAAVIPVVGRAAAPIEVSPASLVLPLTSGNGPIFMGTVLCRSRDGVPLTVAVASAPDDLEVAVIEAVEEASVRLVRVTLRPSAAPATRTVRLLATAGDTKATLEIPIVCNASAP